MLPLTPLEDGLGPLYLNKLESPSPRNFVLKLTLWFWRFYKVIHIFVQFCYYPPLEMEVALHLNKLEFPSPKNVFCQVWLKLTPCFYEKGEQTDEWTGDQKNSPSFQLS